MKWRLFLICVAVVTAPLAAEARSPLRFAFSDAAPPFSYSDAGVSAGILRELLDALFLSLPAYPHTVEPFPWARAQVQVRDGVSDGFVTFPSESRRAYAQFTAMPLYIDDYGYLIYAADNPRRAQLDGAQSFEDLQGLLFVSQESVEWEKENVPAFLERTFVVNGTAMFHMTFSRHAGDFFIMGPAQAVHYAGLLGYKKQLVVRKVGFIPNSQVPFHLGLRRTLEGGDAILAEIDHVMASKEFQTRRQSILERYSHP